MPNYAQNVERTVSVICQSGTKCSDIKSANLSVQGHYVLE